MSVSNVTSNDLLYQTLYQTNNTSSSSQNTVNTQGTQAAQGAGSFSQILQNLGTDLQSGNMTNAQQDFAQLQQLLTTVGNVQGHHHHRHGHGHDKGNTQTAAAVQPVQVAGSQGTTSTGSNVLTTAVSGISSQTTATS